MQSIEAACEEHVQQMVLGKSSHRMCITGARLINFQPASVQIKKIAFKKKAYLLIIITNKLAIVRFKYMNRIL